MAAARPYYGPVELLTIEEVATRMRVGVDAADKHYTGRRVKIGKLVRIYAADLHEWLVGFDDAEFDPWSGVGDAEEKPLSKREQGERA